MQTHQGIILNFDPDKGYGFIHMVSQKDLFFHVREYRPNKQPTVGESVVFELGEDKQGRICATNIQELSFVLQKQHQKQQKIQKRQAYEAYQERRKQKHGVLNTICVIAMSYFALVCIAVLFFNFSKMILFWYVIMSIASFIAYYTDKQYAKTDDWRIPEKTLHIIDVLGGWIGASFAHKFLNHKATKAEFRGMFYITIIANIFGIMLIDYIL
ncbi:MAG: DUF1294 domain-containing protein [Moraxella sp.]|uniref:DUF1294 domain-containing protein n=1 Tax=Moraxella sp. TaxID=479 RepID=UPI0026DB7F25|nr:DUF1294 domain-containing protein [Moraxella sp.]MDO4449365.1 DUF1294 domain-containing protein [Moraxella sp.]